MILCGKTLLRKIWICYEKEAVEEAKKLAKQTNKSQIVANVNMRGRYYVEDDSQKFYFYDPDYAYQDDLFVVRPNGMVLSTRTTFPSEKYHTSQELKNLKDTKKNIRKIW